MNIKNVTMLIGAILFALFGYLSFALIDVADLLDREATDLAKAGESIRVGNEIKSILLLHNRNDFLYQLHQDPSRLETKTVQLEEISTLLEAADQLVNNQEEADLLTKIRNDVRLYLNQRNQIAQTPGDAVEKYNLVSQNLDETLKSIEEFILMNRQQLSSLLEEINYQNKAADRMAITLFVLAGMILVVVVTLVFKTIVRPLTQISQKISQYASGKSAVRAEVMGLEEARAISANFNSMADHLEERRQDQLRFLASIAHDLRNPLNSMSMAAQLLMEQNNDSDQKLLQILYRQTQSLDRLVGDLLNTTRIEAGEFELNPTTQDVGELIKNSVDLAKTSSYLHQFAIEISDEPLITVCDGARLSQVMNNLISNAVKYSPNGGTITLRASKNNENMKISITDEGIGIHPEDKENIFKPFHRTKSTRGTIPGIGLGLSASRKIVEAHGGSLSVESTPGKGSTFRISFPIHGPSKATFEQKTVETPLPPPSLL